MALSRGRYGKYLPQLQTILDLVILNVVFTVVVVMNLDIRHSESIYLIGVSMNVAFIPAACYFYKSHSKRTRRTEKLIPEVLRGVVLMILSFTFLMAFLSVPGITRVFYLELTAALVVVYPGAWLLEELLLRRYRRSGKNYLRAVIVGTGDAALNVINNIHSDLGYGIRIYGYLGCQPDPRLGDIPYLGPTDILRQVIRKNAIQEIYYVESEDRNDQLEVVIKIAEDTVCKFYYIPPLSSNVKREFYLTMVNSYIPALSIHNNPLQNPLNSSIKRLFDIVFSGVLMLLSPIVIIPVAIAIKISSPGPVFFRQIRTGLNGRSFWCYKFRTMKVNVESDTLQASKDDDRITRVGNFLRRTSIDELPQFWNVFKGDMSVVGPRPHMLAHTETYRRLIDKYMVRHLIKPGITGYAQIRGCRGATEELWKMERRVDYDVWYIEHWSFFLDMKIIVRTVADVLKGDENAY